MNLINTIDAYLEHNMDGLEFLIRDKNTFHARDVSVVFKSQFSPAELALRKKHNLTLNIVEGKCMRALFYDFQEKIVSNPIEASGIRVMDLGNVCENVEREYYKDIGIHRAAHVRLFDKQYQISGELDNLVWEYDDILLPDGRLSGWIKICEPRRVIGVEIKSFYGYYAEKEIVIGGQPKWNHVLQSLIYLDHYKPNIPYWLLIYLSRGGSIDTPTGRKNGRQFKVQISKLSGEIFIDGILINEFTMAEIYERFKKAQFCIDNNMLPDRDYVYNYPADLVDYKYRYNKGEISLSKYNNWKKGNEYISDWQCNYCPYLVTCWKDVFGNAVRGAKEAADITPAPSIQGNCSCDTCVKEEAPKQEEENETKQGEDAEGTTT